MKTRLFLAFVLGVLGTLAVTQFVHPKPVKAALVDPLNYIIHQDSPNGPISVLRTNDPAVQAIVNNTPDTPGAFSSNGLTQYKEGSPYLPDSIKELESDLYIGK